MIVGLDIGTNHIRVAIGELNDSGGIEIAGTASRKSAGLRNGVIVNIEDAAAAIKEAVESAEQTVKMLYFAVEAFDCAKMSADALAVYKRMQKDHAGSVWTARAKSITDKR